MSATETLPPTNAAPHCRVCGDAFTPHPKVKDRQKLCAKPACRIAWRLEQQAQWRKRHPTYFQGRYRDLKAWRENHPAYQRQWRAQRRTASQQPLSLDDQPFAREIQSQLNRMKTGTPWQQAQKLCEIQSELNTQLHQLLARGQAAAEARYNLS